MAYKQYGFLLLPNLGASLYTHIKQLTTVIAISQEN